MKHFKKQSDGVVINTNRNGLRKYKANKQRQVAEAQEKSDLIARIEALEKRVAELEANKGD